MTRPYTTEEILAKCPSIIRYRDIPVHNVGGRPRTGKFTAWNENDRIKVASIYTKVGNAVKCSEITGVPVETIRRWRHEEWWPQVVDRIHREKDDEHDLRFTQIIDKSLDEINDRLANGDYVYDVKHGELLRKPMGGKELGVITSIMADKRDQLRRNQKTQVETASTNELLKQIANTVRDFAKKIDQKTIEGEVIPNDNPV